jgi:hypothetical protein
MIAWEMWQHRNKKEHENDIGKENKNCYRQYRQK